MLVQFCGILFSFIVATGKKGFLRKYQEKKYKLSSLKTFAKRGIKKNQVRELYKGGAGAGRAGIKFP